MCRYTLLYCGFLLLTVSWACPLHWAKRNPNDYVFDMLRSIPSRNSALSPFGIKNVLMMVSDRNSNNKTQQMNIAYYFGIEVGHEQQLINRDTNFNPFYRSKPELDFTQLYMLTSLSHKPASEIGIRVWSFANYNLKQQFRKQLFINGYLTPSPRTFKHMPLEQGIFKSWIEKQLNRTDLTLSPFEMALGRDSYHQAYIFKQEWAIPFEELKTSFHFNNFSIAALQLISKELRYLISSELRVTMVRIPYDDRKYSMVLAMPFVNSSLDQLVAQLNGSTFEGFLHQMDSKSSGQLVNLTIPKFGIKSDLPLLPLKSDKLNLTKLYVDETLNWTHAAQETHIEISRIGTNTALWRRLKRRFSCNLFSDYDLKQSQTIVIDKPFLYFVLAEDSHYIPGSEQWKALYEVLFTGQVHFVYDV